MNTQRTKKHIGPKALAALGVAGILTMVGVLPAEAAAAKTYSISAQINCSGALYQGDTFRPHSSGGASITLTDDSYWRSGWSLRVGLRHTDGTQITNSLEFKPSSRAKHTWETTSGSTTIPAGDLATNSRVDVGSDSALCISFPPSYSANLVQ